MDSDSTYGDEKAFWLHLSLVPGIGYHKAKKLLTMAREKQIAVSDQLNESQWRQLGAPHPLLTVLLKPYQQQKCNIARWINEGACRSVITPSCATYPPSLLHISSPPLVLFVSGDSSLMQRDQLAIVGSRGPSTYGRQVTKQLTCELVRSGWVITSGLASGIDGVCHQSALESGGQTIGVLGCGIDQIYPSRHRALIDRMLTHQGAVISEFAPGVRPRPEFFPRRNRIISGLSKGVLVVEAAKKSGSLITARLAAEQGKEVFAVPGNINNPLSEGCHSLIQQGAKLVTSIEDINDEFHIVSYSQGDEQQKNIEKSVVKTLASSHLLDSVDYEVTTLDKVTQRTGLPVTDVLAKLLEYELQGWVASVHGGYIKLRGK